MQFLRDGKSLWRMAKHGRVGSKAEENDGWWQSMAKMVQEAATRQNVTQNVSEHETEWNKVEWNDTVEYVSSMRKNGAAQWKIKKRLCTAEIPGGQNAVKFQHDRARSGSRKARQMMTEISRARGDRQDSKKRNAPRRGRQWHDYTRAERVWLAGRPGKRHVNREDGTHLRTKRRQLPLIQEIRGSLDVMQMLQMSHKCYKNATFFFLLTMSKWCVMRSDKLHVDSIVRF